MTLSLRYRASRGHYCRRIAGAAALLVLLALAVLPAHAQTPPADLYTATAKVDVTADTAPAARDKARLDGQRQALTAVIKGLSGDADTSRLSQLDDHRITDMVISFSVADERMSAVRYQADLTYHFRPADVRRVMQNYNIAAVATPNAGGSGMPVVVLPVYLAGPVAVLWGDPNPWRRAWTQVTPAAGASFVVPLGDAADLTTIDAARAGAGDAGALAAIGTKNGAATVVVATAAPRRQDGAIAGVDVTIKRYRQGQLAASTTKSVAANPGESAAGLLQRTADAVAADLAGGDNGAAPATGPQATVAATVPITSLGDWLSARRQLTQIPAVRRVDLLSLSRHQAAIDIVYTGGLDQLQASLTAAGINLVVRGPQPRPAPHPAALSPIAPAGMPPPR